MAQSAVSGQNGGASAAASSDTYAFGSNVTSGNTVIIAGGQTEAASDAWVAGDCTKSAGTATIGTPVLLASNNVNFQASIYARTALWLVPITGSGSLTMQISNGSSPFWTLIAGHEFTETDSTAEDSAAAGTATDNTNADTGNATSAGNALFAAVVLTTDETDPTVTPDGSYTEAHEESSGGGPVLNFMYRLVTTGTTDSGSWTIGNNKGWSCSLAVIAEDAAGGGGRIMGRLAGLGGLAGSGGLAGNGGGLAG